MEKGEIFIYSAFESLKAEKRERIINAALSEFEKSGFDKASTNEIVKKAGISKGSLFHYFENKKDLYLYLIEHTQTFIEKVYEEIDFNETDIFKRIKQIARVKFKIHRRYPQVFDFLKAVDKETASEIKADIEGRMALILENGFKIIYENIDWSKFKENIDIEKAVNILTWTMFGFSEKERDKLNSYSELDIKQLEEWDSYSEILKSCFYKKEEE